MNAHKMGVLDVKQSIDEVKSFKVEEEASHFGKENDEGSIEYKWKLVDKDRQRIQKLATQMHYRLSEGVGGAVYRLGVEDNGNPAGLNDWDLGRSLHTLRVVASVLETNKQYCQVSLARVSNGHVGKVAEVKVNRLMKNFSEDDRTVGLKICCTGSVGSGKSTLIGVLTTSELDDGEGSARQDVFRHLHELRHGRTSSISRHLLGFDDEGKVMNKSDWEGSDWSDSGSDWSQIVEDSTKVITFIDLAGHEGYIKTTIYGLVSQFPDYSLIAVSADKGLSRMTKQHLGLSLALELPLLIAVTKVDVCSQERIDRTLNELKEVLQVVGEKVPVVVKDAKDAVRICGDLNPNVTPIFLVSSVTGDGLTALKACLHCLPLSREWVTEGETEFLIDSDYDVSGVGTVVHGTVVNGAVVANSELLLGPDKHGQFQPVNVASIHYKKSSTSMAMAGTAVTLALDIPRQQLRKGMALIHPSLSPSPAVGFDARIRLLHHRTCVKNECEVNVIFGTATQAARITSLHPSILHSGDHGLARFHFNCRPEWVKAGLRFIFRAGHTRGVGEILTALTFDPSAEAFVRRRKKRRDTA